MYRMIETDLAAGQAQTIHYDLHAKEVLANPYLTQHYRKLSERYNFAAVLFGPDVIDDQLKAFAADELATISLENTVYVVMLNGGVPFGTDMRAAMHKQNPDYTQEDAALKVSTTDVAEIVDPRVLYDHKGNNLTPLKNAKGKYARLKDDGVDTRGSIEKTAHIMIDEYGFASVSGLVALAKYDIDTKPEERVLQDKNSNLSDLTALFTTPFGPWGEGYGFDNVYSQANEKTHLQRVIGISMLQMNDKNNLAIVEAALEKIGGKSGFATADMDDIVRWNQRYNEKWYLT